MKATNSRIGRCSALLLLLTLAAPRYAAAGIDNVGTTGANFLSLGSSAGVLGMGGAAIATFGDLSSLQWNAASLGSLNETQMVFSHAPLTGSGSQDWVGIGGRMGYSATRWAVHGIYQGDGSFDGRDALGNSTGSFSASSMALGATVSHTFGEIATVGLGAKIVSENLASVSGFGGTFDAGLQVQRGPIGFGLAAQNFGGRITYGGVPYSMPTNIGAGVSYSIPMSGLRFALDYNRPSAYYGDVRAGVEWMWKGRVALRTGYRHEMSAPSTDALNGTTFGMGAGVRGIWFDYGYLAASNGNGEHRIALRVSPRMLNGGLGLNEQHADAQAGESSSHAASLVPAETPASSPRTETPKSNAPKTNTPKSDLPATASSVTATSVAPPAIATAPPATSTTARTTSTVTPATTTAAAANAAGTEVKPAPQAARGNRAQLANMAEAQPQQEAITPRTTAPPKAAVPTATATRVPTWAPVPAPVTATPSTDSGKPATANDAAAKTALPTTATASDAAAKTALPTAATVKPAAAAATPAKTTSSSSQAVDKITVKSGDTMASIARRFNTSVAAIMMENDMVTEHVKPGQKLKIPNHQ
jgi:LysM repeat protein